MKIAEDDGTENFRKRATFIKQNGFNGFDGSTSFESLAVSGRFIRHRDPENRGLVALDSQDNTKSFENDATWQWKTSSSIESPSPSPAPFFTYPGAYYSACTGFSGPAYDGKSNVPPDATRKYSKKLCMDLCKINGCTHLVWTPLNHVRVICDLRVGTARREDVKNRFEGGSICAAARLEAVPWDIKPSQWVDGRSTVPVWADDCMFYDNSYLRSESNKQDCKHWCALNEKCTHYDWRKEKVCQSWDILRLFRENKEYCYLKHNENINVFDAKIGRNENVECGFAQQYAIRKQEFL